MLCFHKLGPWRVGGVLLIAFKISKVDAHSRIEILLLANLFFSIKKYKFLKRDVNLGSNPEICQRDSEKFTQVQTTV